MMRFRFAGEQGEIIFRHAEERGHLAARRSLAVQAVAVGDEVGVGVEFEFYGAASALSRVFLGHGNCLQSRWNVVVRLRRCTGTRRRLAFSRRRATSERSASMTPGSGR